MLSENERTGYKWLLIGINPKAASIFTDIIKDKVDIIIDTDTNEKIKPKNESGLSPMMAEVIKTYKKAMDLALKMNDGLMYILLQANGKVRTVRRGVEPVSIVDSKVVIPFIIDGGHYNCPFDNIKALYKMTVAVDGVHTNTSNRIIVDPSKCEREVQVIYENPSVDVKQ